MKNLKIRTKILLGFTLVDLLTVIVSLTGIVGLRLASDRYSETITKNTAAISALADMRELFQQERLMLRAIAVDINETDRVKADIKELESYEAQMNSSMAECEKVITDDASKRLYSVFREAYTGQFSQTKQKYTEAALRGDAAGAMAALEEGKKVTSQIMTDLRGIIDSVGTAAKTNSAAAAESANLTSALQIGVAAASLVLAAISGLYISNIISKPVSQMAQAFEQFGGTGNLTLAPETAKLAEGYSRQRDEIGKLSSSALRLVMNLKKTQDALERVAQGDLTVEFEVVSDTDAIGTALNTMLKNLNAMFAEVEMAAVQVAAGSAQVSNGAQSLAEGAVEQAAVTEELSRNISAVAVKTRENAKMAEQASRLAIEIKDGAERGNTQMEQMLKAVKEIQEASTSIGNVIKVIDDIAFQTNILALNAAVEAARAGQQGKGFAVVAEEVRSLAAKSAEAAKNTESLIEDTMAKAEFGAQIAGETAESLAEIVRGLAESGRVVGEIADISEEQSAAIMRINKGIEQVSSVIQANSAAAQESAAASEEMSSQSDMLEKLVERFSIKDTAAGN